MKTLHITNGDSATSLMHQAGLSGDNDDGSVLLPWRDILHEGPVPGGLSLKALAEVRAGFIEERGWADAHDTQQWFEYRDDLLLNLNKFDNVILWFEHDLYDQLQLIQILHIISNIDVINTPIELICTENYLGEQTPDQLMALQQFASLVTDDQITLGNLAWQAFTNESPLALSDLCQQDMHCLRFLNAAFIRFLQEFPDSKSGLTQTQKMMLRLLSDYARPAGRLFAAYQHIEARRFMGDTTFWFYLQQLIDAEPALVTLPSDMTFSIPSTPDQVLSVTDFGNKVLSENEKLVKAPNHKRWMGGTQLTDKNYWVWDDALSGIRLS